MSAIGTKQTCQLQPRMSAFSLCGGNVLIHAEQVSRVVALLDLGQTIVVFSVCRADPVLTFVHHEIYVCASCRIGMQRVPIVPCPVGDLFFIRGVWVDTNYDSGPRCIANKEKIDRK